MVKGLTENTLKEGDTPENNLGKIMRRSVLNKLAFYKDKAKGKEHAAVRDKVEALTNLYAQDKIPSFKTVENVLEDMTSRRKHTVQLGIKAFDKLVEKYGSAITNTDKKKKKEAAVKRALAENKAALKITGLFKRALVFDVSTTAKAMNKNLIDVNLLCKYLGNASSHDVESIIARGYQIAVKHFRTEKQQHRTDKFRFYSSISFRSSNHEPLWAQSTNYTSEETGKWFREFTGKIFQIMQSAKIAKIRDFSLDFHFAVMPSGSGGKSTQSRDRESILKKDSVAVIKNKDNNCFWYALCKSMNPGMRHDRITLLRTEAEQICIRTPLPWNEPISLIHLPEIEEALDCNIYVINMISIPILGCCSINLWEALMYKSPNRGKGQHWLLHDENHYHTITNIKGFLGVRLFCPKCFRGGERKETFEKHECDEKEKKREDNKDPTILKDIAHYMKGEFVKGSAEEIKFRTSEITERKKLMAIEDSIRHPKYIIFDFETDTHTNIHIPNHVEVACLKIHDSHDYGKCITQWKTFEGYGCEVRFCEWLFTEANTNTTVMAHNGAGYDNKFVLKWCLMHGLRPDAYIRQGSRITYMHFEKYHIRFIDTYHFLLQPLRNLSKTYDVETVKGHFPHHFNRPENQNYIGKIPDEKAFGVMNMDEEHYENDFKPWYQTQKDRTDWNFKTELIRYCVADVELLAMTVVKFRKMFMDDLDCDPFRYTTLSSLCMSIYKNKFLEEKTIVANDSNKKVSLFSKEWLMHLNDVDLIPEVPVIIKPKDLKLDLELKHYSRDKATFTVDAINKKKKNHQGGEWLLLAWVP
jgi:hypothetical protein